MANNTKNEVTEPIFIMNPPMADAILCESEKDRAEYYKKAYENEKAKNKYLEEQMDNLNKSLRVVHDEYLKIDKKFNDAVSKSAQIMRSKQD